MIIGPNCRVVIAEKSAAEVLPINHTD